MIGTSMTGAIMLRGEDTVPRRYFDVLYETATTVNSTQTTSEVLQRICAMACRGAGAKAASIRLLSSLGDKLLIRAAHGLSRQYLDKGPVEVEHSPVDREALKGTPVTVYDVAADDRFQYPEEAQREGIASVLSVPLSLADGSAIGVLRIYTGTCRHFADDEIEFVCALATLGAIAIQNANRFEKLTTNYEALVEYVHRPW